LFAFEIYRVIIYKHKINATNYYINCGGPKLKVKNGKAKQEPIKIDYENKRLSIVYFMPLLLIAGFVPLIVYAKYIDLSGTTQSLYWTGQQQYLDFFSYWKSRWVIALTLIGLIFYIILYKQKKLPFKNLKQYYIPLGLYAIFVIISTIFAKDTQTALWGFVDMYQGMFVLLSYVIITFLTINFVNSERDVNLFVNAFLFLMIVEGIIGVGQYFGFDFFQTGLGKSLIVPGNIQVDGLSFSFGPKTIYGTLFNTNFVGSFATLMLPLSVAILLGAKTKKQRISASIAVVLMVFIWIGCNSRAGYFGVAVSTIFAVWLFRKVIKKYWIGFTGLVVVFVVILVGLNNVSEGNVFNRLKTLNFKEQIENFKATASDEKIFKFKDIMLGEDTFGIKTTNETLNFRIDGEKLYFLDESDNELEITTSSNEITINDKKYTGYKITIADKYPGVTVNRSGRIFNFYFTNNGVKLLGSGGRIIEPMVADKLSSLDGLEKLASYRGYIWGRTIPLLKDYVLIGSGPDNYTIVFPQDDTLAKVNTFNDPNMIVDKPHNLYLQIATNTGVISLLSLLTFLSIYIFNGLRLYSKINYNSMEKYIGASCLVCIIGYLAAGMFNDNVASVTPMLWIILGLSISINLRLRNRILEKKQ
jgi:hypothetical protein